ncbi:MAG: hypothetical protein FJW92_06730 [Actinobacteria bacterium]|nr:hypothetical protein [Actinomycetota bacterium]
MPSDLITPSAAVWSDVDLKHLRATEDTLLRIAPAGAVISSLRPQWGYLAVLDLAPDSAIDEIRIALEVCAGEVAVMLATRDDSLALYQQCVPAGWHGDVFLPFGPVEGGTQAVIRSASADSRPTVVHIESIGLLSAA